MVVTFTSEAVSARRTRWATTFVVVAFTWAITWWQLPVDTAVPEPVEQVGVILVSAGPAGIGLAAILGALRGRARWATLLAWVLTVAFAGYATFVAGLVSFTSGDLLCDFTGHDPCYTAVGPRLLGLTALGALWAAFAAVESWVARRRSGS